MRSSLLTPSFLTPSVLLALTCLLGCGGEDEVEKTEPGEVRGSTDPTPENELVSLDQRRVSRPAMSTARLESSATTSVDSKAAGRRTAADERAAQLVSGDDGGGERRSALTAEFVRELLLGDEPAPRQLRGALVDLSTLKTVRDEGGFVVRQSAASPTQSSVVSGDTLTEFLATIRGGFREGTSRLAVKAVGVDEPGGVPRMLQATLRIEWFGEARGGEQLREVHMRWRTSWLVAGSGAHESLRLFEVLVTSFEETHRAAKDGRMSPLFEDVTAAVFRGDANYVSQHGVGIEAWASRVTRLGDMHLAGHHGLAVGDVNGDGLEDLFVCDAGSLPNRLYVQLRDGTVVDASKKANLDWLEDSRSALLIDLDGDGDQDLVVATIATVVFAENDGAGVFTVRGGHMGAPYPYSLSAADYDLDGDLDVYVCVYSGDGGQNDARGFEGRSPVPFEDATNGGRNVLLENLGSWKFADASKRVGLDQFPNRWSFAASWEDFDRDGDADLYVANDFGKNQLFRSERSPGGEVRFVEVAEELGVEDVGAGMSVSWGDFNRDGVPDLYVGNMFSAAGRRESSRGAFRRGRNRESVRSLRRMASGNSLFAGRTGDKTFIEQSGRSRSAFGRWSWSSGFVDIDNDGWEDLVIANGFLTSSSTNDL